MAKAALRIVNSATGPGDSSPHSRLPRFSSRGCTSVEPSADVCCTVKSLSKVSLSEAVHTREYQCSQFERDPIRNRQPVEFLEQRRYIVILPGPTDSPCSYVKNGLQTVQLACRQPRERCVATIKPSQQSDDITRMGSGLRTLRTCLSAAKQFDTVLEIWLVIERLEWR